MTPSVDPQLLTELLEHCVDFAKQLLANYGEFHPFGAQIGVDQKLTAVGAYNGSEYPPGRELALLLTSGFRQAFAEGTILAAALAANVDIPQAFHPPFPDGIRVRIECRGYARDIYLPYRIQKAGFLAKFVGGKSKVEYGNYITVERRPDLDVSS